MQKLNALIKFQLHTPGFIYINRSFGSEMHYFYQNTYMFDISCTNMQPYNSRHLPLLHKSAT
jgi:hypothetical protein